MKKSSDSAPLVLAVSGVKNSGKTTLLTGIIPMLRARGLRVAVIKHDGHDFECDVPGTDSRRLLEAGADGIAVYSPEKLMLVQKLTFTVEDIIPQFGYADLILLEGNKHSPYKKIEVLRRAVSAEPVCDPVTLIALYTDTGTEIPGVPTIGLGDHAAVVERILATLAEAR